MDATTGSKKCGNCPRRTLKNFAWIGVDSSDIEEMHLYSKSSEPSLNENLSRLSSLLCAVRQINLYSYKQVIQNKTRLHRDLRV